MNFLLFLISSVALGQIIPATFDPVVNALHALYDQRPELGPKALRLAWHSAGTWIAETEEYGSEGGHIRFKSVLNRGANLGLDIVTEALEPLYHQYPGLTYADLYMLAGVVAVDHDQGPLVNFCGGRSDWDEDTKPPDTLLPPAANDGDNPGLFELDAIAQEVYEVYFKRMGYNTRESVALMAAHSLGRMNQQNSGFHGTWDLTPHVMDNMFFTELVNSKAADMWGCFHIEATGTDQFIRDTEQKRVEGSCSAPYFEDAFNMNPFDMALVFSDLYRDVTEEYALDQQLMLDDYRDAWQKMVDFGVTCDYTLDINMVNEPLDIFNLGPAGTAQMSFVLLIVIAVQLAACACVGLAGLDACCKMRVHPSGSKNNLNDGYSAMH